MRLPALKGGCALPFGHGPPTGISVPLVPAFHRALQRAAGGPDGFPAGKDRYEGYGMVNAGLPDVA